MESGYYKIAAFFSRARQETVLQEIERSFYEAISPRAGIKKNLRRLHATSEQINFCVSNYYFEEDLSECLFGFDAFISKYNTIPDMNVLQGKNSKIRSSSLQPSCEDFMPIVYSKVARMF